MTDASQATHEPFATEISRHIWDSKYRYWQDAEGTIEDTWLRIARALAAVEQKNPRDWEARFYDVLKGFKFLPGGRIQAGAGTGRKVTLFNCFVMAPIEDSMEGIFRGLHEGAITMQQGGGVGYDFSTLRPRDTRAKAVGAIASGPVSFMHVWDAMCATVLSTGARRGAMMATLRCDHPDIEEFVAAKQTSGKLQNFNLSVQVTDDFIEAVRDGRPWPLVFPAEELDSGEETVARHWPGTQGAMRCTVVKRVEARTLWDKMIRAALDYAEPGVLFIDRINRANNLSYREHITATNPCGEIPLPPYGACDLGSINLTQFVRQPFSEEAHLDRNAIRETVTVGTRLLDNVIDVSLYPLDQQRQQAQGSRRIGLGITGLADALIMLGLRYGEANSLRLAEEIMRDICHTAYGTSVDLARQKGSFPFFERDKYLASVFVRMLPEDIQADIARHGIRNSHLTAIAPTGTISLLANNISSGLEPVFFVRYRRKVLDRNGRMSEFELSDYAWRLWRELRGPEEPLPMAFVEADEVPPRSQLEMQAALQRHVDSSISKTIYVPKDFAFEDLRGIYELAYEMGVKGCTTFRPNPITGEVLKGADESGEAHHCCTLEREAD